MKNPSVCNFTRIDVTNPLDLNQWAVYLKVSEEDLRKTIEKIGPASDAVTEYLKYG